MPTSLTYVLLSTRGCSPWRPDAVMGTTGREDIRSLGFSRTVESAPDTAQIAVLSRRGAPISCQSDSRNPHRVKQKRQLCPELSPAFPSSLALPPSKNHPASRFGTLNPIPFRAALSRTKSVSNRVSSALRIDSPMSNQCSHGTLLHFSLQGSHLNICYYHQDLH